MQKVLDYVMEEAPHFKQLVMDTLQAKGAMATSTHVFLHIGPDGDHRSVNPATAISPDC